VYLLLMLQCKDMERSFGCWGNVQRLAHVCQQRAGCVLCGTPVAHRTGSNEDMEAHISLMITGATDR
jgi:hypothetical protein